MAPFTKLKEYAINEYFVFKNIAAAEGNKEEENQVASESKHLVTSGPQFYEPWGIQKLCHTILEDLSPHPSIV